MTIILTSASDAIQVPGLSDKIPGVYNSLYFPIAKKEGYRDQYEVYANGADDLPVQCVVCTDADVTAEMITLCNAVQTL